MANAAEALTQVLMDRLFLPVEASGRHVHVTGEEARALFGHQLTPKRPLSQPGQFLCQERVTIRTDKGEFQNVAVLGPERPESQVEISLTDAVTLGLKAPICLSGQIQGTPGIDLIGPAGQVRLSQGVIVAQRHIHLPPEDAARRGLHNGDTVKLRVFGLRALAFDNVAVRVHPDFAPAVHLDFDEANACGFQKGDLGMVVP